MSSPHTPRSAGEPPEAPAYDPKLSPLERYMNALSYFHHLGLWLPTGIWTAADKLNLQHEAGSMLHNRRAQFVRSEAADTAVLDRETS